MKWLQVLAALLVFAGLALAIRLGKPEPPDLSPFGSEVALPANLGPLAFPDGTLAVAGRVRTSTGTPAADALVALLAGGPDSPDRPPAHWTYTDEEGRFRLERVQPGDYRVALMHPSAPPRSFLLALPQEGELLWDLAAPLPPLPTLPEMRRGGVRGVVRVPPSVAAEAPVSLAGCEVVLRPAPGNGLSGAVVRRASCDESGAFEVPELVLARYQVEVLPPWAGGGSWPVLGRGTLDATDVLLTSLAVTLDVGGLRGRLLEAQERPLEGAMVRVLALGAKDPVGDPQAWPTEVTDAQGRFWFRLLPPGRYRLHLRAGLAARDVEGEVRSGETTEVAPETLDPRAGG